MVQEGKKSVDVHECTQVTPMQNHDVKESLSSQECCQDPGSRVSPPTHLSSVGNQDMFISPNRKLLTSFQPEQTSDWL